MSHGREVHANLMSTASVDLYVEQGELAVLRVETAHHAIMRHRRTPPCEASRHLHAAHRIAADALRQRSRIFLHPAMRQSHIFLLHFARRKLRAQLAMR